MSYRAVLVVAVGLGSVAPPSYAQKSPEAGYVFPPGGKAGTTIDVKVGGYDWTPDMEFIVHDRRMQLTPTGALGPILIPPPPYWFGAKGRLAALPLPREVPAKFVIPVDMPPGPIYWQAANANGCTEARVFIVGNGPDVIEDENRKGAQLLPSLPMTVSGRLAKNEEVDRYRFTAPADGPITCELMARRLGSKFVGLLAVHDSKGQLIKDSLGTASADPVFTFMSKKGAEYTVSLHDIDFGGDRSFVYRLSVTPGPRVLTTLPHVGKRGAATKVGLVLDRGDGKPSIAVHPITFPASDDTFDIPVAPNRLHRLKLGDLEELRTEIKKPTAPVAIAGVLDNDADHYEFDWKKGETWSLSVEAKRIGSTLDVAVAVFGPDGKELAKNDDLPGTTDAGLDFTVPADGVYKIAVSDSGGKRGWPTGFYRLVVDRPKRDFALTLPTQRISVPIGGKFDLPVTAVRTGGFKGPIALTVKGFPAGVSAPANLVIPADKPSLVIPLQAAKDAGTNIGLITIEGTADLASSGGGWFGRHAFPPTPILVTHMATARTTANLAPRGLEDERVTQIFLAITLKPAFKGQPVDQDTGRKVHRGSTFPADVIVERLDGFQGEIVLQMAATQSYQVQGITGGDVVVPPGVGKVLYPVFMPEWLETTRTSRCGMVGVAKVADPKGKVRYLCNGITGFITMTLEGALLKVSAEDADIAARADQPFEVRLKIARLTKLNEPAKIELKLPAEMAGQLKAEPMVVAPKQEHAVMRITPAANLRGLHEFTIRATALQDGKWLAVSEATVTVELAPTVQAPPKLK